MITEAEALALAREHLVATMLSELRLTPVAYTGGAYLLDDPSELLFFHVERGECRVGSSEIVAIRKRDGAVRFHGMVGE
jgi:hypothetical protein